MDILIDLKMWNLAINLEVKQWKPAISDDNSWPRVSWLDMDKLKMVAVVAVAESLLCGG